MKSPKYGWPLLVMITTIFMLAGCSSLHYVNERAVSIEEVINMSRAGVDKDVIIRQLDVTRSRFKLSPDDIVLLTEAGVKSDVIEIMVESGAAPEPFSYEYGYRPYENWINYYDYYGYYSGYRYHYPYYSANTPYMYMSPYVVYREPGLVGRFYRYVPLGGRRRPYSDYYHRRNYEKQQEPTGKEER